jgi:hypothetical protein
MQKFRWLRSLGPLGSAAANVLAILTTNWVLVVSAALAIFTALEAWTIALVQNLAVRSAAEVFIAALWTIIGLRVLAQSKRPQEVKIAHEYAYSIIIENMTPIFNDTEDFAFALAINFRNVGAGPLRVKLDELRVILGDRTLPDSPSPPELILPRLAPKAFKSGGFKREAISGTMTGSVFFSILYGPPDGAFARRFSFRAKLHVIEPKDGKGLGYADEVLEEKDSPA